MFRPPCSAGQRSSPFPAGLGAHSHTAARFRRILLLCGRCEFSGNLGIFPLGGASDVPCLAVCGAEFSRWISRADGLFPVIGQNGDADPSTGWQTRRQARMFLGCPSAIRRRKRSVRDRTACLFSALRGAIYVLITRRSLVQIRPLHPTKSSYNLCEDFSVYSGGIL